MAKRAKRSFTLYGDGRTYTIHPTTVYADNHPVVTANPSRFNDIVEETGTKLATPSVVADPVEEVTATVTWGAVDYATSYTVTTSPATDTYVVSELTVDLEGLSEGTEYTVNVVAANGNPNHTNSDAGTDTFTTEETVIKLATPSVVADPVGDVTATVTWDAVDHATSYTVTTSPVTDTYVVSELTVELEGLTAETEYTVSVVATSDNPNHTNSDAGTDTFTTTA